MPVIVGSGITVVYYGCFDIGITVANYGYCGMPVVVFFIGGFGISVVYSGCKDSLWQSMAIAACLGYVMAVTASLWNSVVVTTVCAILCLLRHLCGILWVLQQSELCYGYYGISVVWYGCFDSLCYVMAVMAPLWYIMGVLTVCAILRLLGHLCAIVWV